MTGEKAAPSALIEFEAVRVPGGVLLRIELGEVKTAAVISTEDARMVASALKFTAALPVPRKDGERRAEDGRK